MLAIKSNSNLYYNIYPTNNYNRSKVSTTQLNTSNALYNSRVNFNGKINKDSFTKVISEDPIKKLKRFTTDEYLKLSEAEKNILRLEYNKLQERNPIYYKQLILSHNYVANAVKTGLDKRFGGNNYVVILIGRSLSSIGKSLETKLGSNNVVNVPLSNAGRYNPQSFNEKVYKNIYEQTLKDKGLNNFLKFLEENNLSKKDVELSGKNYIIMDYCATGNSLKGAEQLFKSDLIWENKNKNIYALDIIKYLRNVNKNYLNIYKEKFPKKDNNIIDKLEDALLESKYKDYSTITKSEKLKNTISASREILVSDKTSRDTKLVWFKLLDSGLTTKENIKKQKSCWDNFIEVIINKKEIIKKRLNITHKRESNISQPKIELWNDKLSQYESDLRNDIYEISKILIKEQSNKLLDSEKHQEEINILQNTYKNLLKNYNDAYGFLEDCYNNHKTQVKYYQNRLSIHKMIDKINSK